MIHENYDYMTPRTNIILQLHRELYQFSPTIGRRYKNSDNVIAETDVEGNKKIRFEPVSSFETPEAMERLADTFIQAFVKYYLEIILSAYKEFSARVEHLKNRNLSKPERVKLLFDNTLKRLSKRDIHERCPDISTSTIEITLNGILKDGYIIKIGAGKNTAYIRNTDYVK